MWKNLEKRYPDYSLKILDIIFHKCISFHEMKPTDPNFDKCLFELCDLMRAKGDVITINNFIVEAIHMHKLEHCHCQNSKTFLFLMTRIFHTTMKMWSAATTMKIRS